MSLPRADYQAYDEPIRVYGRRGKDELLDRLKTLHPEQDPYRECNVGTSLKSPGIGRATQKE
jgi:hypothetical protein